MVETLPLRRVALSFMNWERNRDCRGLWAMMEKAIEASGILTDQVASSTRGIRTLTCTVSSWLFLDVTRYI
jgi:hypothetical protein